MLRKSPSNAERFNAKRAKLAASGQEGPHVRALVLSPPPRLPACFLSFSLSLFPSLHHSHLPLSHTHTNPDKNHPNSFFSFVHRTHTTHKSHITKQQVQWDEETIAEHDKDRGTRQIIDEPPTPYRYGDDDDNSDDLNVNSNNNHPNAGSSGGMSILGAHADYAGSPSTSGSGAALGESPQAYASSPSAQVCAALSDVRLIFVRLIICSCFSLFPLLCFSRTHSHSPPHPPTHTQAGDNVMDVWESLRAKLYFEQQQQQQQEQQEQQQGGGLSAHVS